MAEAELKKIDQGREVGYRPQIVACVLKDKQILFVFKKKHDLWQLPQGGIDNQENFSKAFLREMAEELGSDFVADLEGKIENFGEGKIDFNKVLHGSRDLKTDSGDEVVMKGKSYYFCHVQHKNGGLKIKETEFDDYRWLTYQEAIDLTEEIYQKNKKIMTLEILRLLHEKDLI